ncbi:MAG: dTDP-4-dehydrorhamnose 3,5-epimerase family protein [Calditrichia bacterium]
MEFKPGEIEGVITGSIKKYEDSRGWLMELFRMDQVHYTQMPVMAYVSETKPGIARGPHEHWDQTDYFCFLGPSEFKVYLWDNRENSKTYGHYMEITGGESKPIFLIVPPGVVHGYKNVGSVNGWVFNAANRLYAGWNREEEVDEIRHEQDENSPFFIK